MTKQECAIVMSYTGVAMLEGDDLGIFYKYVEKLLGRPMHTHEYPQLAEEIKQRSEKDFIKLCREAADR